MRSLLQTRVLLLGFVFLPLSRGQLIGSRGIFTLPDGEIYRDAETVDASESVARFARSFQPTADRQAESNRLFGSRAPKTPRFYTSSVSNGIGRKLSDVEVFDFVDSRYLDPLPETRFNKPLEEVELELSTPRTRALPGQPFPVSFGQRPQQQQQQQFVSFGTAASSPALQFGTGLKQQPPVIQSLPKVSLSSLPTHRFSSSFTVGDRQPKQAQTFQKVPGTFQNFFNFNNQRIYKK